MRDDDIKAEIDAIRESIIRDEIKRRVMELMGACSPLPTTDHSHNFSAYASQNGWHPAPSLMGHMLNPDPITTYRYAEGDNMATQTESRFLYEVIIIDSRDADDEAAVYRHSVRASSEQDAKLRAIMRGGYKESHIEYLDFIVNNVSHAALKPVVEDEDDE